MKTEAIAKALQIPQEDTWAFGQMLRNRLRSKTSLISRDDSPIKAGLSTNTPTPPHLAVYRRECLGSDVTLARRPATRRVKGSHERLPPTRAASCASMKSPLRTTPSSCVIGPSRTATLDSDCTRTVGRALGVQTVQHGNRLFFIIDIEGIRAFQDAFADTLPDVDILRHCRSFDFAPTMIRRLTG